MYQPKSFLGTIHWERDCISSNTTLSPSPLVVLTVRGNEVEIYFGGARHSQRYLQKCITQSDVDFVATQLKAHAQSVYDTALAENTYVNVVEITMTNYTDIAGDCSKIKFIYDQEMAITTESNDNATIRKIIELPLKDQADRQTFVTDLLVYSGGIGKFAQVTGVSDIFVTATDPSTGSTYFSPPASTYVSLTFAFVLLSLFHCLKNELDNSQLALAHLLNFIHCISTLALN